MILLFDYTYFASDYCNTVIYWHIASKYLVHHIYILPSNMVWKSHNQAFVVLSVFGPEPFLIWVYSIKNYLCFFSVLDNKYTHDAHVCILIHGGQGIFIYLWLECTLPWLVGPLAESTNVYTLYTYIYILILSVSIYAYGWIQWLEICFYFF